MYTTTWDISAARKEEIFRLDREEKAEKARELGSDSRRGIFLLPLSGRDTEGKGIGLEILGDRLYNIFSEDKCLDTEKVLWEKLLKDEGIQSQLNKALNCAIGAGQALNLLGKKNYLSCEVCDYPTKKEARAIIKPWHDNHVTKSNLGHIWDLKGLYPEADRELQVGINAFNILKNMFVMALKKNRECQVWIRCKLINWAKKLREDLPKEVEVWNMLHRPWHKLMEALREFVEYEEWKAKSSAKEREEEKGIFFSTDPEIEYMEASLRGIFNSIREE